MALLFSYLTDLGLFFFVAQIFVFSVAGGLPLYGAFILLGVSIIIRIMQDTNTLIPALNAIPAACGRDTVQQVLTRKNVAFYINGLFLVSLGILTILDIAMHYDAGTLFEKLMVATNGFGYGFANIRKSAELDGLWVLPSKESLTGNLFVSLGRPESISVFSSFPAAILASPERLYLSAPFLFVALMMTIKTGNPLDNALLSQPKRILAARIFIASSNIVAAVAGFSDGKIAVSIGLLLFFIGNCVIAYRTYAIQNSPLQ